MIKRLLFLSDGGLYAYDISRKIVTELQCFENETQFTEYLLQDLKTPIAWLVDTAQEEFQTASIPHVLGKDRRDLLTHKMRRLFEFTHYAYAQVQGREGHGRRDDRVLFAALNNPNALQPWLQLIIQYKVPLIGISSIPLLSQYLLKYVPHSPYLLLIGHTPPPNNYTVEGLRQSFFIRQQLQLSRLVPLNYHNPEEYADYIFSQIVTTHRYLESARLLPDTTSLTVVILTHTSLLETLNRFIGTYKSLHGLIFEVIDSNTLAEQYKLPKLFGSQNKVYLHHLVMSEISGHWFLPNHYAQANDTRYFNYRKIRSIIYMLALLLLLLAGWFSKADLDEAFTFQSKGEMIQRQIDAQWREIKKLRDSLPKDKEFSSEDIRYIRNVVDMGRHISAYHISPQPLWESVSRILANHKNLHLVRLEWAVGKEKESLFQNSSTNSKPSTFEELSSLPPVQVPAFANRPSVNKQPPPVSTSVPSYFFESIILHGKLKSTPEQSFDGNYKRGVEIFEAFTKELHEKGGTRWEIIEKSLPYNPIALSGQVGSETQIDFLPFAIQITVRHPYAKNFH